MQVILIRHGETVWSEERRYQGVSDVPLSSSGKSKLKIAEFRPARVFVTEMVRTRETAEILFPGARQVVISGLCEMNFGIFEGKNYQELNGNPVYQAWVDSGCLDACPGGESKESFCGRVCGAFEELMENCAGEEDPVLVAHGGTLMAVLERFGRPERAYFDWHIPCGCGVRLEARDWREKHILQFMDMMDFRGGI